LNHLYSAKGDGTLFSPARAGVFIEAHHLFKKFLPPMFSKKVKAKGETNKA
jgi:hypothetical protein